MKNRRILSLSILCMSLVIFLSPVLKVKGAPMIIETWTPMSTWTPMPTETVQPTLTAFVPSSCLATSVFPTPLPFYTPTNAILTPSGTGTVTPTNTFTPTVTSTPYGQSGQCDVFTIGPHRIDQIQFGVIASSVSVVGGCYVSVATGYCEYTVSFARNSNFSGSTSGVEVTIPVYGLVPLPAVTMYYHETDHYIWSGGTMDDVMRIGFVASTGCAGGFGVGMGGNGSCTVRTNTASPGVSFYCAGKPTLDVFQSCHIIFDFVIGSESCFDVPVATAVPTCGSGIVNPSEMIAYFNPPSVSLLGCYEIFPAYTIPLPSLSWSPFGMPDSLSFPGWQLCIQLLSFSAVFAGVDWALLLGGFVSMFCIGGIYVNIKNQT